MMIETVYNHLFEFASGSKEFAITKDYKENLLHKIEIFLNTSYKYPSGKKLSKNRVTKNKFAFQKPNLLIYLSHQ